MNRPNEVRARPSLNRTRARLPQATAMAKVAFEHQSGRAAGAAAQKPSGQRAQNRSHKRLAFITARALSSQSLKLSQAQTSSVV